MPFTYSTLTPHIHLIRIVRYDFMADLNPEKGIKTTTPITGSANLNYNMDAKIKKGRKLTMALEILIVIAIIGIAIVVVHNYKVQKPITSTVSTVTPKTNVTAANTTTAKPKIGKIFEPIEYITANAFISSYNFSSPLKYQFRTAFEPYTADANCTGLEGILGYMQNQTMISVAYNLSKLDKAQPISEYAAVEGINPSNVAGYKAAFESNGGFCRPSMSLVMSGSSVSRSKYVHDNVTVYFFEISDISANATEQFGSYLGPKPNMTVYMAEAMYGNYTIKATSAGFSTYAGTLGLMPYTKNIENSTINAFENYVSSHPNATK